MKTLALLIEYDGTNYCGWQIQNNGRTIQSEIEKVLNLLFDFETSVIGAGRTDAGVHAKGQVAHVLLIKPILIPENKLAYVINSKLPADIRIKKASILDYEFHARFDAIAREYSYTISSIYSVFEKNFTVYSYKLPSFEKLNEAAYLFLGKHDFSAFSKINEATKNYFCNVELSNWLQINDYKIRFEIKADRFVYGMVRALVGVMIAYANGKIDKEIIISELQKPTRRNLAPSYPPHGLILEKVYYRENIGLSF